MSKVFKSKKAVLMTTLVAALAALLLFAVCSDDSNSGGPTPPSFCEANPQHTDCITVDPGVCEADSTAHGCPGFCGANPTHSDCVDDPCAVNPNAPGCGSDPCVANPNAPGCGSDPCETNFVFGCPGFCDQNPTNAQCGGDPDAGKYCVEGNTCYVITPGDICSTIPVDNCPVVDTCAINLTFGCPGFCDAYPAFPDCNTDPCVLNPTPNCPNWCELYPEARNCPEFCNANPTDADCVTDDTEYCDWGPADASGSGGCDRIPDDGERSLCLTKGWGIFGDKNCLWDRKEVGAGYPADIGKWCRPLGQDFGCQEITRHNYKNECEATYNSQDACPQPPDLIGYCCWLPSAQNPNGSCVGVGRLQDSIKTEIECTSPPTSGTFQDHSTPPQSQYGYCNWAPAPTATPPTEGGCFPILTATENTNCKAPSTKHTRPDCSD